MSPTLPNVPRGQSYPLLRAIALRDRVQLREFGGRGENLGEEAAAGASQLFILLQFLRTGELAVLCSCFYSGSPFCSVRCSPTLHHLSGTSAQCVSPCTPFTPNNPPKPPHGSIF